MCESLLAVWACGAERCEDLDRLRGQDGLGLLLGHGLPAAQTARDFLATFEEPGHGRCAWFMFRRTSCRAMLGRLC